MKRRTFLACSVASAVLARTSVTRAAAQGLTISWDKNILTLHDARLAGGKMEVWYLEAYCRPGSTDREWGQTTIRHETRLVSASDDRRRIELQCVLNDGVTVDHVISASQDEVDFRLTAHNPTSTESQAHWAQPCIRVGDFTGLDKEAYIRNCFVFLDGKLQRMPTRDWATKARYTPGQVWAAPGVDRDDVNPRPLNPHTPSHGLIGCFSADGKWILATAWEPYQELFQGIIGCIHNDFRIGGLQPGETKKIHGKIYLMPADVTALVRRYEADFPERPKS